MSDICEDKTSPYDIRPSDAKLIGAAKSLGHKLASISGCTEEQRNAITAMLTFLENLPAPPPPQFNAEFGFQVECESVTPETPLCRGWNVSVCRSCFEIGSFYSDAFCNDDFEEFEFEFEWMVCPGKPNLNGDFNLVPWINQVFDPESLVSDGYRLLIDASVWKVVN